MGVGDSYAKGKETKISVKLGYLLQLTDYQIFEKTFVSWVL
jgi:hypothetical protein